MFFRRGLGGFNLLKQLDSRLYLNCGSNKLVIIDLKAVCEQKKLPSLNNIKITSLNDCIDMDQRMGVATKSETQNVFVLEDGSLIFIGSKNVEFW